MSNIDSLTTAYISSLATTISVASSQHAIKQTGVKGSLSKGIYAGMNARCVNQKDSRVRKEMKKKAETALYLVKSYKNLLNRLEQERKHREEADALLMELLGLAD